MKKTAIIFKISQFLDSKVLMESLEHRLKQGAPIIAEYLGGSVNCDAYHITDPRFDGLGISSWRILVSMEL
ncbi:3-oxoacyl-[acyl-carrier-protein] synthase I, chloroplastic [Orobanche minor]